MGFLKKELQPGLCVSLKERPPSIFQKTGFCNGTICWTTPGLKLNPIPPTPSPRKIPGSTHDYASVICSHAPLPTEMVWDGRAKMQPKYSLFVSAVRAFNIGTVISVILYHFRIPFPILRMLNPEGSSLVHSVIFYTFLFLASGVI